MRKGASMSLTEYAFHSPTAQAVRERWFLATICHAARWRLTKLLRFLRLMRLASP
jgi:hypothetical protein